MAANECAVSVLSSYLKRSFPHTRGMAGVCFFRYRVSMPNAACISGQRYCAAALMSWYVGFHCSASSDTGSKTIPAVGSVSHIAGVSGSSCSVSAWAGWLQARTTKAKSKPKTPARRGLNTGGNGLIYWSVLMVYPLFCLQCFKNMNLIKSISYENTRAKFALCRLK